MVDLGQPAVAGTGPHPGPPGFAALRLSDLPLGAARRPARARNHLLMLVSAGHGRHSIDFVEYTCRPGTLLWSRPGQVHQFSGQPGLDATLLLFAPDLLPDLPALDDLLADPFSPACWLPTGEDEDAILTEVTQLATDCHRYRADDPYAAELLRHQLAVLLTRIATLSRRGTGGDVMVRFRREIESSFAGTRRVEDYADRLGYSVRTLTRACLAATGRSAKQVVDARVALEAKRLLACTDLPVAEVGRRLGFPEPTNFGRFFIRETGRTPGEFRAVHTAIGS